MNDDAPDLLRRQLVEHLRTTGSILSQDVEDAFRTVPRHVFLPGIEPDRVYRDEVIVTKTDAHARPISSSSQPAIMAIMLEQLGVAPGHRVLEIGAATGYNAALLAHLVGPDGSVVTIDIDDDLVESAREHLAAAGLSCVTVVCGDGARGWLPAAPYDRIILTVGVSDLAPAWLDQLAPGGSLVLPLAVGSWQYSIAFEAAGDHWQSRSVRDCGFMRLRGELAGPETRHELGQDGDLSLELDRAVAVDPDALCAALAHPAADLPIGVRVTSADLWWSLGGWLAVQGTGTGTDTDTGTGMGRLTATRTGHGLIPVLQSGPGGSWTVVLVSEGSLAALVRLPPGEGSSFELGVRPVGPRGPELAERLRAVVQGWDVRGRPSTEQLDIRACPRGGLPPNAEVIVEKEHVWLALDWQPRRPAETSGRYPCAPVGLRPAGPATAATAAQRSRRQEDPGSAHGGPR